MTDLGEPNAASKVRRVAADVRRARESRHRRQMAAVRETATIARAGLARRIESARAEIDAALAKHADGTPPPLLRLAQRSTDEKPYNAYLGWLLDPMKGHGAALPALRALAATLGFEALSNELDVESPDVTVRCERPWPEGAGSSREPDLLIVTPSAKPRAILLLENKVRSGESGDQYGPYLRSLESLASHYGVPSFGRAAFLLAPGAREKPDGWTGSLLHDELASCLAKVARDRRIPRWDRLSCYLVAEAFLHERALSERLCELRQARDALRGGEPSFWALRRALDLLPLPAPFGWSNDDDDLE